jgi:hypothetical protein
MSMRTPAGVVAIAVSFSVLAQSAVAAQTVTAAGVNPGAPGLSDYRASALAATGLNPA